MTVLTLKQVAALRLMLSIEKTTRTAEIIREHTGIDARDTDTALRIGSVYDSFARATLALEDASAGITDVDAPIQIDLPHTVLTQLHNVVVAGAYTIVNPDAADAEGAALIESLRQARKSLLTALTASTDNSWGFPSPNPSKMLLH